MNKMISLETKKYEIRLENFEGPLDLLCHLVDKNKMDIYKVNINQITEQYIKYINDTEKLNLEITSEFLIMASTLLYIKSKGLLPKEVEEETELTEEELIRRIIEYKKYKEISKILRERYIEFSKRCYKFREIIELPKKKLEEKYEIVDLSEKYKNLLRKDKEKTNVQANNIERIGMREEYTVTSKVKEMFRVLMKKQKFIFNKLFSLNKCSKNEVVTAFAGLLEMTRKNKVTALQNERFGDILVEKKKR